MTMKNYFDDFSDKACCYEDLKIYEDQLEGDDLHDWRDFLDAFEHRQVSIGHNTLARIFANWFPHTRFLTKDSNSALVRSINAHKLRRYILHQSEVTTDLEAARASSYFKDYLEGLSVGTKLAETELQPADGLVLLAAQSWTNAWKLSGMYPEITYGNSNIGNDGDRYR